MLLDVRNSEVGRASVSPTDLHRSPPVFSYFARDFLTLPQRLLSPDLWSRANCRPIGSIPTKFGKFLSDCTAPLPGGSTPRHTFTQPVLRRQARTQGFGMTPCGLVDMCECFLENIYRVNMPAGRWRQKSISEYLYLHTKLYGVISQKAVIPVPYHITCLYMLTHLYTNEPNFTKFEAIYRHWALPVFCTIIYCNY